jgi:hypothetical protein
MQRQQEKLKKSGLDKVEGQLSYLSTHPSFEERIELLGGQGKGTIPGGDFKKVNLDYEAFKAKLRETLAKP